MNQSKIWIAAVVVATAFAPLAHADSKNEIRAVTFDEDGGTTRVHVQGAQTPTFTVYKLERPSRVVIDVPQARLGEALRGHEQATLLSANTWAVSTIAAQQLDDNGQVVRVIVTLARPGRYDVKTAGNEVVVMVAPRDAAPRVASPEALEAAQAETAKARASAAAAQAEAAKANTSAATAQAEAAKAKATASAAAAEADRLRKTAAEQAARAQAAQDAASRAGNADAERARAKQAQAEAAQAKQDAQQAAAEADRARGASERAAQAALAEAERAKAQVVAAQASAERAKAQVVAAEATASAAKQDASRSKAEADAARQDAARTRAQAEATQAQTQKQLAAQLDDATRAKAEAEAARRDADAARADAAKTKAAAQAARDELARARSESTAARGEADRASAQAKANRAEADAARADAAQKQSELVAAQKRAEAAARDAAQKRAETDAAAVDVAQLKDDRARARGEAETAKAEAAKLRRAAEAAKAEADAARLAAAADKQQAEAARAQAEQLMRDTKGQLAELDRRAADAQAMDDKARAASAAAQAREEAARAQVAAASRERQAAEAAAAAARSKADGNARLAADAKAAEQRLAAAVQATTTAEQQRAASESAAASARRDLEVSRAALASVEQQRSAAEQAASDAARKRGEAEAAASDAGRRRSAAELAAAEAGKQRSAAEQAASDATRKRSEAEQRRAAAEQQRVAAEDAAKTAKQAADAAERQRRVAEGAARSAIAAKRDAESGLAELSARRTAAEKAAGELEARSKAEAKAAAELTAARARQASDAELASARAEVARLTEQRQKAESELADRRKSVAQQQAEAERLKLAATAAHDAADREESRRTQLATQRVAEEQALAKLDADKQTKRSAARPPAMVRDVTFTGDDATGHVTIALAGDATVQVGQVSATVAELIIDHAGIGQKLERKLDVSRFGGPVKAISSFRDRRVPDRVRLVAELASPATPSFDRDANTVRWSFVGDDIAKRPVASKPTVAARTTNVPSPVVGGFGATSTPVAQQSVSQLPPQGNRRRVYHGQTIEIHAKDAPIHDLLRIIADTGKVSIVVPDTIEAKVTLDLKRVPWDQALEVILSSHQLWYRREGNLYRIAPRKELDAEDEAEAARREAQLKSESPRSQLVPLNYASATDLSKKLEPMLSPHGKIAVDERTNQLIITDVSGNRDQISRLALSLDTQTPQISIEARIVEARSTFLRQIGVQWGGRAITGAQGGNATGLTFPSSISLIGGNEDQNTIRAGIASPSDFAVNLPAATGSGEGGALGISLGSVAGNFNINLRLSALEDSGTVRIISAPKVTVLNNKQASIASGVSIPISTVSATGTQTQFVQADLRLDVTPTVSTSDCAIAMNLFVQKNEPDFVNVGARGDPTILRKEARTSMIVSDGETSVLGGIYTRNSGLAYKKIPLLGDIPVLGWLFKNRRENDDRTEILVFITPKITNRALLRCK